MRKITLPLSLQHVFEQQILHSMQLKKQAIGILHTHMAFSVVTPPRLIMAREACWAERPENYNAVRYRCETWPLIPPRFNRAIT